jgi:oxalate decarboxylase
MSRLQRRDFLTGSAALGAATAAALAATKRADAGDPSFTNNVPDPILAGKELPTFKFELDKRRIHLEGRALMPKEGEWRSATWGQRRCIGS